jgi:DNA mismatch repair protein MutL
VDVNVHPAKAEVRFKDANLVKSCVISAIKQGIRNIGSQASDHLTEAAIEYFTPQNHSWQASQDPRSSATPSSGMTQGEVLNETARPQYIQPSRPSFVRPIIHQSQQAAIFAPIAPMTKAQPQEFNSTQIDFPLGAACGQIHDTYIISQTKDGMILIDQHAAHERIFYERLKKQILDKQIQTQRLFIPEIIELPEHILESLMEQKQELAKLGLYFEHFGSSAISVTELPSLLRCGDVKKLIMDIVDDLSEYSQQVSLESKINHFLATFACHHSIRAGRSLAINEMNSLLREMENVDHTGQCNHGRPTYIKLSLKDIEKLFERT